MSRFVGVVIAVSLVLAACGGSEDDRTGTGPPTGDCTPAPTAPATAPDLPSGFPTPEGVVYTEAELAGPTTIVRGYFEGDFEDALQAYKDGFAGAGYSITDEETEADEGEVNFAGGGTDGQVKAEERCEGRAELRITIRPTD